MGHAPGTIIPNRIFVGGVDYKVRAGCALVPRGTFLTASLPPGDGEPPAPHLLSLRDGDGGEDRHQPLWDVQRVSLPTQTGSRIETRSARFCLLLRYGFVTFEAPEDVVNILSKVSRTQQNRQNLEVLRLPHGCGSVEG